MKIIKDIFDAIGAFIGLTILLIVFLFGFIYLCFTEIIETIRLGFKKGDRIDE